MSGVYLLHSCCAASACIGSEHHFGFRFNRSPRVHRQLLPGCTQLLLGFIQLLSDFRQLRLELCLASQPLPQPPLVLLCLSGVLRCLLRSHFSKSRGQTRSSRKMRTSELELPMNSERGMHSVRYYSNGTVDIAVLPKSGRLDSRV